MIEQLTVFLENSEGRLAALTRALANDDVNMTALTIAETSDYGLVRIICNDVNHAIDVLEREGFRATKTKVLAVELPNRPGALADLLEVISELDVNIEYGYCFSAAGEMAVDVLKLSGNEQTVAVASLRRAGYHLLTPEDVM